MRAFLVMTFLVPFTLSACSPTTEATPNGAVQPPTVPDQGAPIMVPQRPKRIVATSPSPELSVKEYAAQEQGALAPVGLVDGGGVDRVLVRHLPTATLPPATIAGREMVNPWRTTMAGRLSALETTPDGMMAGYSVVYRYEPQAPQIVLAVWYRRVDGVHGLLRVDVRRPAGDDPDATALAARIAAKNVAASIRIE
jgi:ABC-type Fe3+-hydroxamate transport system substrate-binding protein